MTDKTDNEDSSYNHLKNEKSPYLLQHADNPVNWYPWSEEAFQKAKKEDKPIFLSIGYSTCHWCHVMAHESFEDEEIAKLLNETFVCIKVDREERPDIDNLYMKICTMLTGRGGWPLTIILDTQKRPFFAGTYFPKESRYGVIGLKHLIYRIRDYWENRRSELETSAKEIITELQNYHEKSTKGSAGLDKTILKQAFNNIEHSFDNIHGGFSVAPKFPSPHKMYFLLRYWQRTNNQKALEMVEKTLTKMRLGGIYDQLGFGFHRYSTDRQWKVPHFEKMLYDQALLIFLYTEAYQATNKVLYQQTVVEIISYLQTTLLDKQGGFYSAQDADSEGEEGKYYTWTNKELKDILTKKEYSFIASIFTIIDSGNFVDQASGEKTGRNILYLSQSFADLSEQFNLTKTAFLRKFTEIRQKLL
ncbi:MAG: thioredoxin domain-containing protein, partial [Asgard group archaeon]|nr:thioredoxin domain-containing protein [Asgard group archaeon]